MTAPSHAVRRVLGLAVAAAIVAAPSLASAAISGGVDVETSLSTLGTWILGTLGAIVWVLIFLVRGLQLGLSGRGALPYIGYAVGGAALFFGAAYLLTSAGFA